ncbi:hypothetical protein [Arthrobacter sp. TMS1-12-1]
MSEAPLVHPVEMRSGTRRWKDAVTSVLALLNDVDPYGLQPGTAEGAPQDEYELEAAPIVSLLLKNGSVRSDEVDAIWVTWFQEPLSEVVGSEQMIPFCASLNSLNFEA